MMEKNAQKLPICNYPMSVPHLLIKWKQKDGNLYHPPLLIDTFIKPINTFSEKSNHTSLRVLARYQQQTP